MNLSLIADAVTIGDAARLRAYHDTLRENFIEALALVFPVVERRLGADCFRQIAREFVQQHPLRSDELHHIGKPFPAYLRQRFADSEYDYLADVGALEWACQESQCAAGAPPFDPARLRDIPPDAYDQLRFTLHPACRLIRSAHPIAHIWAANQADTPGEGRTGLPSDGDLLLLTRGAGGIELRRLGAADFALLEAFSRGAMLGDALDAALLLDPEFNLDEALSVFVILGVLTGT